MEEHEERSAIIEYYCGVSRPEAETIAMEQMKKQLSLFGHGVL